MSTLHAPPRMSAETIPAIDFSQYLYGTRQERADVSRDIHQACRRYGFFYLDQHGIADDLIDNAFDAAREFFDLPLPERIACKAATGLQNRGYQAMFDTQREGEAPDVKESFDMGFPLADDALAALSHLPFYSRNAWPRDPAFRSRVESLYFAMLDCGHQVLRAMADSLGIDTNFFVARCRQPFTNMRLVHYPPQPKAQEEGIGARAHTDKGLITLLLNDANGGLHVESDSGAWIDAPPRPGALIINVGDLLTRWTNGRFRSAVHRVVNASGNERFSIPQFHHLNYFAEVNPSDIPGGGESVYPAITAGEFVSAGFRRDRKSWRT
ncbi:isopenicillin N synthase family dioxygenase [Variovorax sp.]|uniref:isopenicillin N synthase family dioxygenase n=1 Tax=Variovorax sp. TaxID=1871043 RepID=UPI002D708ADE|nr:2-oxoglutarate and iron-dependent oxygenase domain-containing protein [Variovorax sp.]HYP83660.1 2-oxoglutarate and iron-dependent oxygenase domain-containing protein [Variovorax sp.]